MLNPALSPSPAVPPAEPTPSANATPGVVQTTLGDREPDATIADTCVGGSPDMVRDVREEIANAVLARMPLHELADALPLSPPEAEAWAQESIRQAKVAMENGTFEPTDEDASEPEPKPEMRRFRKTVHRKDGPVVVEGEMPVGNIGKSRPKLTDFDRAKRGVEKLAPAERLNLGLSRKISRAVNMPASRA